MDTFAFNEIVGVTEIGGAWQSNCDLTTARDNEVLSDSEGRNRDGAGSAWAANDAEAKLGRIGWIRGVIAWEGEPELGAFARFIAPRLAGRRANGDLIILDLAVGRRAIEPRKAVAGKTKASEGRAWNGVGRHGKTQIVNARSDKNANEDGFACICPGAIAIKIEPGIQPARGSRSHGGGDLDCSRLAGDER